MSKRRTRTGRPPLIHASPDGYSTDAFTAAVHTRPVAESVDIFEPETTPAARVDVREANVGGTTVTAPGRVLVRLIRAGWSLNSNYWPAEVLRRDGPAAWPKGTLCYIDHAPEGEEEAYPSGSIRNLAATLTTDARWDDAEQALFAEARLFHPWRDTITDMAAAIGMSIRAWVTCGTGEAEGREGEIIESIPQGRSVDFVTVPAAGGGIVSVLEAVGHRPAQEARNAGHWFEARIHSGFTEIADRMFGEGYLSRAERITLSSAVGDALAAFAGRVETDAPHLYERDPYGQPEEPRPAMAEEARRVTEAPTEETRTALTTAIRSAHVRTDDAYAWVRDFDPDRSLVWFETGDNSGSRCWQQGYSFGADGIAALVGTPIEVATRITYVPVVPGAAESAPATPSNAGDAVLTEAPAGTEPNEDVTDGAPPTAPSTPREQEPAMSGTETGAPPVQAGTATVADAPVTTTQEAPQADVIAAAVQQALGAALAPIQQALAAQTERANERDAENRSLRNTNRASEAVTTALRAANLADVATQIGPRVTARVLGAVPTGTDGSVDETALAEAITSAVNDEASFVRGLRAEALESAGVGQPYGLGAPKTEAVDDGFEAEMESFFGGVLGMTTEQAKIAAAGRN